MPLNVASILITAVKFLATLATAFFGVQGVRGNTTNEDGTLNKRGKVAAAGVLISAAIAVVMLSLETYIGRERGLAEERDRVRTSNRLDSILTHAQGLSDSLGRLKQISLRTFAQESTNLGRSAAILQVLEASSDTQAALLTQQRSLALDASRLLYPLSSIAVMGRLVYRLGDAPLDRYAQMVRHKAVALLREGEQARRDSTGRRVGAAVWFGNRLYYNPEESRLIDGNNVVFGQASGVTSDAAISVDSVSIRMGSQWLPEDSVPQWLDDVDVDLWFTQEGREQAERPDLAFAVSVGHDEPEGGQTLRQSVGTITVDFVHHTLIQDFATRDVTREYSSGAITSVLDLPGSTMMLWSDAVSAEYEFAYPVRMEGFLLAFESGKGREVRIPTGAFQVRENARRALFTHYLSVSDVESHPGEFARFLVVRPPAK